MTSRADPAAEPLRLETKPLLVWKVFAATASIASVRYRCLLPALHLEAFGWRSVVIDSSVSLPVDSAVVIFVKSFTDTDMALALQATARGCPIILDLCDNIFVPGYGAGAAVDQVGRFDEMAALAAQIVTPTAELARRVSERLPRARVVTVPDQCETRDDVERLISGSAGLLPPERWRAESLRQRIMRRIVRVQAAVSMRKRVLWFGNHGAHHSSFGMGTLSDVLPALREVNREIPLELVVVSNNEEKFRALLAQMPFPARYRAWGVLSIFDDLRAADVCVLPTANDEFSVTKSANRTIFALTNGVPVVASSHPALVPLRDCVVLDDWRTGLHVYLSDEVRRERDLARARAVIAESFSSAAIARQWHATLTDVLGKEGHARLHP